MGLSATYLRIGIDCLGLLGGGGGTPDSLAACKLLCSIVIIRLSRTHCCSFCTDCSDRTTELNIAWWYIAVDCVGDNGAVEFLDGTIPRPNELLNNASSFDVIGDDGWPLPILIICDNLVGSEERDWAIICSWFAVLVSGNDCGRAELGGFAAGLLLGRVTSFGVGFWCWYCCCCCWRSKYDCTAFFWNAFSAVFGIRVVFVGSK